MPRPTEPPDWIRSGEVARILGVSVRTVRNWTARGVLPSVRPGGHRLFSAAVVGELAERLGRTARQMEWEGLE